MGNRVEIQAGTDLTVVFRLRNRRTKDPIDLTNMTAIRLLLKSRSRILIPFVTGTVPAKSATGIYQGVTYSGVTPGNQTNAITLSFNGTDTVAQVITAWNQANTMNQVQSDSQVPSVIPTSGVIVLDGGWDAYQQVSVFGDPKLGKIQLILKQSDTQNLQIGSNQSMQTFVDFGLGGPRRGGKFENLVDVYE